MTSVESLTLTIAGLSLHIEAPAAWAPDLRTRYAAFLSAQPPAWQITLHLDPTLETRAADWVTHEGLLTRFRVGTSAGWIDLARQQAVVSAPSAARAPSALERTLVFILLQMLPRLGQGLLLHAAGLIWQGRGHVFFGPSGAGKTTLAGLAPATAEVVSDENVILQLRADGPVLLSTPFWGMSTPQERIRRSNRQAPLAALYALEHAPTFSLTRLPPAQAAVALLETEKVAAERASSADAWLQMAAALIASAPVYRLAFRPTAELWDFLQDAAV